MMNRTRRRLLSAFALLGALSASTNAAAVTPMRSSTWIVSAERMASSNFSFHTGGVDWTNQLLGAPGNVPFGTPRLGVDYFVTDGLSVGGHVALGFSVPDQGNTNGWVTFEPRVGYAFALSRVIDFWPRVGLGFIVAENTSTGLVSLEGMFLANLNKYFALEFGPTFDIPLSSQWPDAVLGANGGIAVKF